MCTLKRPSRAMEIDAAGKVGHFPPLFSPLCLRGTQTHSGARWDVIVHVPIFVLKNVHTRATIARMRLPERTGSVRPRPPFSSVPLVVPERARSWCVQPLWTAATQPPRLHAQNKVKASDLLRARSWTHNSCVTRDSWQELNVCCEGKHLVLALLNTHV